MITLFSKKFLCILSILCHIIGISAVIEAATTMPKNVVNILQKTNISHVKSLLNNSRRIVIGNEALDTRPYMVYLKLPKHSEKYNDYQHWLCGGVIIHEEYILTSAACIEDAKHFYIVSGTFIHDENGDRNNNVCIKNGAKKAVWKCVPRNYVFDGHENDNIRWMSNDIAIVKVEDEFDFHRKIRGCDYVPRPICYNNQSSQLEEPDTVGSIAGWGSHSRYNEPFESENSKHQLLETHVRVITKTDCKKRWGKRYHDIIDNYMICTKDIIAEPSELCSEKYVDCSDIQYDDSIEERRRVLSPESLQLHSGYNHSQVSRRRINGGLIGSGGFCENDHGGPLVYGSGVDAVVIGIISACLVKEGSNVCYGPFLYTSVYKNRILINCAIYKNHRGACDKLFRAGGTHTEVEMSWADHPDGPARSELNKVKGLEPLPAVEERLYEDSANHSVVKPTNQSSDKKVNQPSVKKVLEPYVDGKVTQRRSDNLTTGGGSKPIKKRSDKFLEHSGIVLRSVDDSQKPDNKTVPSKN